MNLYITSGTYDYLRKAKISDEHLLFLTNPSKSSLIQEAEEGTFFKSAQKYEVIESIGTLRQEGYVLFNYIPVSAEGKEPFEYAFLDSIKKMDGINGFYSLRLCRPSGSDTYLVITQWQDKSASLAWKKSPSYIDIFDKKAPSLAHSPQKLFTGDSYSVEYNAPSPGDF